MIERGTTVTGNAEAADEEPAATPPLDPGAIERAYRLHRARRRARIRHRRETRRAGVRFWLALGLLVAAGAALAVFIVQEAQRLFGI